MPHAFLEPTPHVDRDRVRQPRIAALVSVAPLVAMAALAPAALAAPVPIGAPWDRPRVGIVLADDCHVAITSGALNTMKWPLCGGD